MKTIMVPSCELCPYSRAVGIEADNLRFRYCSHSDAKFTAPLPEPETVPQWCPLPEYVG